ncbi:glycosyltransferase family 2 protein [Lichenifustis flavocetrariae]|uniref:Glycosyltransferase family 2 protein n=1 Tax=Lichenifustis flavocetrariae TaxID=2949735 RepID=A0AA41YSF1_9HYPH|nr:glycosyltransferase family 2 protein [Lichenifustis flavocetrariae]MCW6507716.1 glycosyltransferase family 2 protein [Lichenifustis flavocetrariae]
MRTLIILVNRNNKKDTIECLESLRRCEGAFDVFVSDNASTDGSLDAMQAWAEGKVAVDTASKAWDSIRHHPIEVADVTWGRYASEDDAKADPRERWVTFASTGGSRGFPAGNNVGLRYGLTRAYDYFWVLNNDTVVEPTALVRLVAKMQSDPTIGICGSSLLFYARPDIVQALGGCGYNPRTAASQAVGAGQRFPLPATALPAEQSIDHILGAAMFVSRAVLEDVGLMNEELYLYFEEIDWTMRLRPKYRSGYEPASIVYHKHGGTMGGGTKKPSRHRIYYMTVNRILFTRKHFPAALPFVVLAILAQALKNAIRGRWQISSWVLRDLAYGLTRARYPLREIA